MTFAIILGLLIIGFAIYLAFNKKDEETPVKEEPTVTQPVSSIDIVKKDLLSMNIYLRENIQSIKVVQEFEKIIDNLIELHPIANDPKKYSQQTVIFNKVTSHYLPTVLKNFILLPEQSRTEQEEVILKLLEQIKTQLDSIKTSFESEDTSVFERNARIMETLFETYTTQAKGE